MSGDESKTEMRRKKKEKNTSRSDYGVGLAGLSFRRGQNCSTCSADCGPAVVYNVVCGMDLLILFPWKRSVICKYYKVHRDLLCGVQSVWYVAWTDTVPWKS